MKSILFKQMINKINNKRGLVHRSMTEGFTIIETMIAISLFLVVVMAGMGALLNASSLHQKSADMRSVMDNLSFIMEDISTNLRTGHNYRCITDNLPYTGPANDLLNIGTAKSGPNCLGIAFESAKGDDFKTTDQWVYYIGTNLNDSSTYSIFRSEEGGANPVQLTPDEVNINAVASGFYILGAEPPAGGDKQEPFATIHLAGTISSKGISTPFSLQTSVSQREIDL